MSLNGILDDFYQNTGDKSLDQEWVDVVKHNSKQAILQWVADEVVGGLLEYVKETHGEKEERHDSITIV